MDSTLSRNASFREGCPLQLVENKNRIPRKPMGRVLDITALRIYRAWRRGVSERELAQQYRLPRPEVELILREQVTGERAA